MQAGQGVMWHWNYWNCTSSDHQLLFCSGVEESFRTLLCTSTCSMFFRVKCTLRTCTSEFCPPSKIFLFLDHFVISVCKYRLYNKATTGGGLDGKYTTKCHRPEVVYTVETRTELYNRLVPWDIATCVHLRPGYVVT